MDVKGVITGDIVGSTAINLDWRETLLDCIRKSVDELSILSPLKMELFRGDSFQIIVDKPEEALKVAVLLRAMLKSQTPKSSKTFWDARIALGVGSIFYNTNKIVISDGEAFQLSGRELDAIGKGRLTIKTRWEDVNDELKVITAFADDIITGWSILQAQVIYTALLYQTPQKVIASKTNKSAQNISKVLGAAKEKLIRVFFDRYSILMVKKLTECI